MGNKESIDKHYMNESELKQTIKGYPYIKKTDTYTYNHSYQFLFINNELLFREWKNDEQFHVKDEEWNCLSLKNKQFVNFHADGNNIWVCFSENNKKNIYARRTSFDDRKKNGLYLSKKVFPNSKWNGKWDITNMNVWSSSNFDAFGNQFEDENGNAIHWDRYPGINHVGCSTLHFINKENKIVLIDPWVRTITMNLHYPPGFDVNTHIIDEVNYSSSASITIIVFYPKSNPQSKQIWSFFGNFDTHYFPRYKKYRKKSKWIQHQHNFEDIKYLTIAQTKDTLDYLKIFIINDKDELYFKNYSSNDWKSINEF